jgi:hypothetical protein
MATEPLLRGPADAPPVAHSVAGTASTAATAAPAQPPVSRRGSITDEPEVGARCCHCCLDFWDRARERNFVLIKAVGALLAHLALGVAVFGIFQSSFDNNSNPDNNDDDGFANSTLNTLIDALYFSTVTFTTVGYGDIAPTTAWTQFFVCAYIFVGIGFISYCLGEAAEYLLRVQVLAPSYPNPDPCLLRRPTPCVGMFTGPWCAIHARGWVGGARACCVSRPRWRPCTSSISTRSG